ncbi:MAG TPA: DEAD/DEAH box helicase family protein, partial [Caldilineaceae bacterium]|nr:DEAD/DEAH box helicase family protein [Caldilineaceae bacterium]
MLQLKEYQQKALEWLRLYFQETVRLRDPNLAYYQITRQVYGRGIPYREAPGLLDMPYVCIRIPTGGGKTLVACHAVGLAAQELLQTEKPLILWLVPSNAILEQTIGALKERTHPYRQAVEQAVGGSLTVLNVAQALRVNRPVLDSSATIVVSTIQAFRVDDTEGRKVYDTSGYLMDHFENLPPALVQRLERWENGKPIPSLCNLLKLRRPLVLVDEAHNARTDLSFETLSRFDPSGILEFSATPDTERHPSNVLYSVSAAELKAEEMIKMPILLETRPQWRELLADAIARLNELQRAAEAAQMAGGEYIRPVMLIQAENRSASRETVTVERVKETLLADFGVPEKQIALSAYEFDELAGVDIQSRSCPLRFVITVSKLKEGWDCPFAYVLCSVAEVQSSTAAEQILGRVMRLPYARCKNDERLNRAYAFVASANFAAVLASLREGLIQNGFQAFETEEMVQGFQPQQTDFGPLFNGSPDSDFTLPPASPEQLATLPAQVSARVAQQADGSVVFVGPMDAASRDALSAIYADALDRATLQQVYAASNAAPTLPASPAQRGEIFSIPRLAYRQGDLLEPFEKTHFMDRLWELHSRNKEISEELFPSQQAAGQLAEIDVTKEQQIAYRFVENVQGQMRLLARDQRWTEVDLILWLDRTIPHTDIPVTDSQAFITGVVQWLQRK